MDTAGKCASNKTLQSRAKQVFSETHGSMAGQPLNTLIQTIQKSSHCDLEHFHFFHDPSPHTNNNSTQILVHSFLRYIIAPGCSLFHTHTHTHTHQTVSVALPRPQSTVMTTSHSQLSCQLSGTVTELRSCVRKVTRDVD